MTPALFVLVDADGGVGRSFLHPSQPAVWFTEDDARIALKHSERKDLRVVEYTRKEAQ